VTTRRDGQQIIYALNTTVMQDLAAILWDLFAPGAAAPFEPKEPTP
jgi:hypothetical protein